MQHRRVLAKMKISNSITAVKYVEILFTGCHNWPFVHAVGPQPSCVVVKLLGIHLVRFHRRKIKVKIFFAFLGMNRVIIILCNLEHLKLNNCPWNIHISYNLPIYIIDSDFFLLITICYWFISFLFFSTHSTNHHSSVMAHFIYQSYL